MDRIELNMSITVLHHFEQRSLMITDGMGECRQHAHDAGHTSGHLTASKASGAQPLNGISAKYPH